MSLGYFSTLMTISGQVIALVMAFYGAFFVYLQQQLDKYREGLVRDLQRLDMTLHALEKEPRENLPLEALKDSLDDARSRVDQIRDKISTYDNYFYKSKGKTVFSFVVMMLTGVLIPLAVLFFNPDWPLEFVKVFSGVGFGLSTFSSVFFICRNISKF